MHVVGRRSTAKLRQDLDLAAARESGGESGIRTHGRVSPTHAFQACSFNHSDISPFRINDLRAVPNSVAQNPPSNLAVPRCDLDSVVCGGASSRSSLKLCQTF